MYYHIRNSKLSRIWKLDKGKTWGHVAWRHGTVEPGFWTIERDYELEEHRIQSGLSRFRCRSGEWMIWLRWSNQNYEDFCWARVMPHYDPGPSGRSAEVRFSGHKPHTHRKATKDGQYPLCIWKIKKFLKLVLR